MQTSARLSRTLRDVVFCKDPDCQKGLEDGDIDLQHAFFVFDSLAFYGTFRFDLEGLT